MKTMKLNRKFSSVLIALSVLIIVIISGCNTSQQTQQPVCNRPYILVGTSCCLDQNNNAVCDTDESNRIETATTAKKITTDDLISFVEKTIQSTFPESRGAFYRVSDDLETERSRGGGCFTGFPQTCESWIYPSDSTSFGEVRAHIYDFGVGDAPTISKVLGDQYLFPGVERQTLSNGDMLLQTYGPSEGDISWFVNVQVPCRGQFWIRVVNSDDERISQGVYLAVANEILKFCKN